MLPATARSLCSQTHTLLQPDETNESSEPLPPAYKCSFSQSLAFPVCTHAHTHTHVLSCSQAHTHSLTPLTLFAGVFCVSSSCWLCKGVHALTVTQMSEAPLTQDKVGERGNYGVLGSVYNWYYHLKWVSCDHLRLHLDLT